MYVKCQSIPAAMAAVSALHGRWFAGKICFCVGNGLQNESCVYVCKIVFPSAIRMYSELMEIF